MQTDSKKHEPPTDANVMQLHAERDFNHLI
jgi:hypothetical protein